MKIKITSKIKEIGKTLDKYWGTKSNNKLPRKPKFKVVFIYCEEQGKIKGFLYAHDIDDGYFRDCIIDEMTVREKSDKKCIEWLLKKLIDYCKKEKISIICNSMDKIEKGVFKKLGFIIEKETEESAII